MGGGWTRTVLAALLALACAFVGARLVGRFDGLRVETGAERRATVDAPTRARLEALDEDVRVTYFVTADEDLPSHLRRLPNGVRDVLSAFQRAAGARFDYRIADPDEHPEWAEFLASAGVAPWRARRVERDGWREERLWSSLRIVAGSRSGTVVNGLGPEHLPSLQRLILAHLDQIRAPRRPRVALAAPPGFERFASILDGATELTRLDFDAGEDLPAELDLLLWFAPRACDARHLAQLDALIGRGGSVVVAGASHDAIEREGRVRFERTPLPTGALLGHFGLRPIEGIVLDARGQALPHPVGGSAVAPHRVRCLATNQDFRALRGQPNGTLLFVAPQAFELDAARLFELGLEATVLGTTGELCVLVPPPDAELGFDQLAASPGRPLAGAALAALLRPADPWSGSLLYLGAADAFRDENLGHEEFAHGPLSDVLLRSLCSDERLVAARIAAETSAPLPELAASERTLWRAFTVAALPLALLGLFLLRAVRFRRGGLGAAPALVLRLGLGLALALALAVLARGPALDATLDRRHRLTPAQRDVLAGLVEPGTTTRIETAFGPLEALPPELRPMARDARRLCDELAGELSGVEHEPVPVGELASRGFETVPLSSTAEEVTTVRRATSAIRLSRGDSSTTLDLHGPSAFETLRFRLAFALWRLSRGRQATVGLAAEGPRLSPAEVAVEYRDRGLFAPREGEAFGGLRELLRENDFEVVPIDPARPELPQGLDLVAWIQPRRDVTPMLEATVRHLHDGGRALVAAQHFRVLARQLERAELELTFWPQPQFPDLEREYLPDLGIVLAREIVFDRLSASLEIPTRVDRVGGESRIVRQESSQAFLVRAAEANFAAAVDAVRGVGDILLPGAARIVSDQQKLRAHGLELEPWVRTSDRAWAFAWSGGNLSEEVLRGDPPAVAAGDSVLAARVRGRFPAAVRVEGRGLDGRARVALRAGPTRSDGPAGELVLIGCSETFRDELLFHPEFRGDAFVLNAVAELALPPELAAFLHQRRSAPGLDYVEPGARARWRVFVLGAFPLLLLLLAFARRRLA